MKNFSIYIFDPHTDPFFSNPISSLGKNFNAKYKFILEYSNWEKYITKSQIYFINTSRYDQVKLNNWKRINQINKEIKFKSSNKLNIESNDFVFISTTTLINLWEENKTQLIKISKKSNFIIAINHYLWLAPKLTTIFEKLYPSHFICERSPEVYSKYLELNELSALKRHKIIEIPYIPDKVLKNCRKKDKDNKCVIIGQTHKLWINHIFTKKTGYPYFHKLRNTLRERYLSKNINKELFDYHGPKIRFEYNILLDKIINNSLLKIIFEKLKIYSKLSNKIKVLQKREISKYYKNSKPFKDIFKKYSIVLCGEEDILNLPVLGIFEAMIAGCVPLGSLHDYYNSLGMEKYKHYIPFDGTYEDAEKEIKKLKRNPKNIDQLISNSTNFIDNNITPSNTIKKILYSFSIK